MVEENQGNLDKYFIEELKLIQEIIKRMASNSFLIKGWAITLIVASLLFKDLGNYQIIIAFIPLLLFWYLDAHFLRQERLFRDLFGWVIKNRSGSKDFLFDFDTKRFETKKNSTCKVLFSITLLAFYASLGLILILLFFYVKFYA